MVEVRNVEVFGLERAVSAIYNSFNVGEIDTTKKVEEKSWKVAKSLGSNMAPHQSHDAYLCGIVVDLEIMCDNLLYRDIAHEKYFTLTLLRNNWIHINTNYRALKHFLHKYNYVEFLSLCKDKLSLFSELTGL